MIPRRQLTRPRGLPNYAEVAIFLARVCMSSKEAWNRRLDYNPWMASAELGSHQPVRSTDPQPDGTLAKDLPSEDILEILRLPDGTIKYQHSIGRPIVNAKGDLVEFIGTAIDVTEQAQARIELEKAFEEIKQRPETVCRSERELRDVVNTVRQRGA